MYEINVDLCDFRGQEERFQLIGDEDTLNRILRTYDREDITYRKLPEATLSISRSTAFCPKCMKMVSIKKEKKDFITIDCSCGCKFLIK